MNNSRGEVLIQLAGEERTMRPTFEAIAAIERDLKINSLPLLKKFAAGDVGVRESATIVYHGLRGFGDTRLSLAEVGDAIIMQGLNEMALAISEFLIASLEGVNSLGKRKAETKETNPTT
jgi:hypothetical protein